MAESIEISDLLIHRDEDGRAVIEVGLRATLYFRNGHTRENRLAVASCFEEFFDLSGGNLRWVIPRQLAVKGDSSFERSAAKLVADLTDEDFDEDDSWEFIWHSGATVDSANNLMLQGYGARGWEATPPKSRLSYLSVMFPLTFFSDKATGLPTLVQRWSERLHAFHGYAGVGLAYSPDPSIAARHGMDALGLGLRFPGIELDYPIHHAIWSRAGIKGGNWITVLSLEWMAKLGTIEALQQRLGHPFVITEYTGGVVIRAGAAPEVGDRNRQIKTPNYVKLAKVLKPIRIQVHGAVFGLSRDEFEPWLARFDE